MFAFSSPAPPAAALTRAGAAVAVQSGYDTEVLADPENTGVLAPVESGLTAVGCDLSWDWTGAGRNGRPRQLDALLSAAFTGYSEHSLRKDSDLRLDVSGRAGLGANVLEARAGYARFRRPGLPLFDLDSPRLDLRLARNLGARWTGVAGAGLARSWYPGRPLEADSSAGATDPGDQAEWRAEFMSALTLRAARASAVLELDWRNVDSNSPLAVHRGPAAQLRAGWYGGGAGAKARRNAWIALCWFQRGYPEYPILSTVTPEPPPRGGPPPEARVDTVGTRRDRTLQASLFYEQRLSSRWSVFSTVLAIRQTSNIDALAFDQLRGTAGLRFTLSREARLRAPGRASRSPAPGNPLEDSQGGETSDSMRPWAGPDGTRFRIRAGEAKSVSIVADWNAWRAGAEPLTDPDHDGIFETVLRIPPGVWRYAFLVDGVFTRPEGAPRYEDDGFGGETGVLGAEDLLPGP